MIQDVIVGFAIGILAAITLIYALQPKVPYPMWMVSTFDHPWTFVPLAVLALYTLSVHPQLGALLVLIVLALISDRIIFARSGAIATATAATAEKESDSESDYSDDDGPILQWGSPLSKLDIDEPTYPVFHSLKNLQPGDPAPF